MAQPGLHSTATAVSTKAKVKGQNRKRKKSTMAGGAKSTMAGGACATCATTCSPHGSMPPTRPTTPYALGIIDDHTPDHSEGDPFLHPTLRKSICPADYNYILKLKLHLTATNYTTWRTVIYRALQTESLHLYLDPTFACPDITHDPEYAIHWDKANLFVCAVLTSTMMEEIAVQIGHIQEASEMWEEAKQLYSGTIATDWTLTVTAIVTTCYTDGEDVSVHIAKMKGYRCDLILMQQDLVDELFACFLCISMPATWNYVFAALPNHYNTTEVEQCIHDEYGIRTSQAGGSTNAFQATQSNTKKSCTPIPGQLYCTNCNISGHWLKDCYSKGGLMNWKERAKKGKKEDKDDEKDKEKGKARVVRRRRSQKTKDGANGATRRPTRPLLTSRMNQTTTALTPAYPPISQVTPPAPTLAGF